MGLVSFSWNKGEQSTENIHFEIKNADGVSMTSFDGAAKDMENGVFYRALNAGRTGNKTSAPIRLTATTRDEGVFLQWEMKEDTDCSFFVYRDGMLYDIIDGTQYLDNSYNNQFHTYYVTAYNGSMESDPSNNCNTQMPSECLNPTGLRYTILSKDKVKLTWNAPQASNVSGYRIYRRPRGGEFSRIKNLSASQFETSLVALSCDQYEYAVSAYYSQSHCESSFATSYYDPSLNYVEVNNTIIPIHLVCDVMEEGIKLVWLTAIKAEQYTIYRNGTMIAEGVSENEYIDTTAEPGQEYSYYVVGSNAWIQSNPSNEIRVDWSTLKVEEDNENNVSLYPNPANEQLNVIAKGLKQVTVFNMLGQKVLFKDANNEKTVLDVRTLNAGTYFIRVTTESGVTTEKFMKK